VYYFSRKNVKGALLFNFSPKTFVEKLHKPARFIYVSRKRSNNMQVFIMLQQKTAKTSAWVCYFSLKNNEILQSVVIFSRKVCKACRKTEKKKIYICPKAPSIIQLFKRPIPHLNPGQSV